LAKAADSDSKVGNGFDEAGDRGASRTRRDTDEAENAAFAGEFDRNAHQRGDAGAIDLWDAFRMTTTFFAPPLTTDSRAS